jgi:hypothetical protein
MDYLDQINNQSWHPMNHNDIKNSSWNNNEFKLMVEQFIKFKNVLSDRSTEYPKSYINMSIQIYEVSLYNIYDPSKRVIQYPWVYKLENDSDWPDQFKFNLFNKYGWSIEIKN